MRKRSANLQVYVAMCAAANYRTRVAEVHWTKIAELTGLAKSTIYAAISALKKEHIILQSREDFYLVPLNDPHGDLAEGTK
jgi:hypothetical protein